MDRPITTRDHSLIDCAMVGTLWATPRLMGWDRRLTTVLSGFSGFMLTYSLHTRYQLGIVKLLPMKAHLVLDGISAVGLASLALLLREKKPVVVGTLLALSAAEMSVALLTKTRPPLLVELEPIVSPPVGLPLPLSR